MKKSILTIIGFVLAFFAHAQIAIGKDEVSSPSVSLDFGNENRGLILPWVSNEAAVANVANGTLIFDADDKKVKVKYNNGWKDLSIQSGTTVNPISYLDGLEIQLNLIENPQAKVGIGESAAHEVPGILVLEESNKAMVLPKVVSPHLNVLNPTPGLMVFDPLKRQLAVFNGEVWTYWQGQ